MGVASNAGKVVVPSVECSPTTVWVTSVVAVVTDGTDATNQRNKTHKPRIAADIPPAPETQARSPIPQGQLQR
ncbi:hypothetical protein RB213_012115 [Colletotrichum asianum]